MGRRSEPIERMAAKVKGDGKTPGGRELVRANPTLVRRDTPGPPAPRGLGNRGKAEWRKIWDAGFWLNPRQDYAWVEQIVRAYDDIDVFRKRVNQDGLVQEGSLGQPVAHPLIAEIRKCEMTIRQCLSVLGFSPTDRARLGIMEAKARKEIADVQDLIQRQAERNATTVVASVIGLPLRMPRASSARRSFGSSGTRPGRKARWS